jgi:hypothetical protein
MLGQSAMGTKNVTSFSGSYFSDFKEKHKKKSTFLYISIYIINYFEPANRCLHIVIRRRRSP